MRSIFLLLLLLVAVGSAAAVVNPRAPVPVADRPRKVHLDWVRTADGWEKPASWQPSARSNPQLHPVVVAGFVMFAALGGLVGFSTQPGLPADQR